MPVVPAEVAQTPREIISTRLPSWIICGSPKTKKIRTLCNQMKLLQAQLGRAMEQHAKITAISKLH